MNDEEVFQIWINKFPKNCMECPCFDGNSDFPNAFCKVTHQILGERSDSEEENDFTEERDNSCTLKLMKSEVTK